MQAVEVLIFDSPLPGVPPREVKAEIGTPLGDIVDNPRCPFVCIIDGAPMARDYWLQRPLCAGDKVEFHPVFLGGGSRSILGAIATIALSYFAPYAAVGLAGQAAGTVGNLTALGRVISSAIVLIGSALISSVIAPRGGGNSWQGDKASSIYNVDTQGNTARIYNPIPVQYGRLKVFPDYAAQPYVKYKTNTNADGDQYYYALFCLGHGEFDIHAITIGDAPISSFADVLTARILPPGKMPSEVSACTVSSEAVAGQSLDKGEWIGGFPVCGTGRKAKAISFDIVLPHGLYKLSDSGKANSNNITIIVEAAQIDDLGRNIAPWQQVFQTNINAASMTPQRRTFEIAVSPARWAVRIKRLGQYNSSDNRNMTSAQWAALRADLIDEAPLCKTATHFELVMRASEQLSSLSQRKIGILCTRKVMDFDGNLIATRSPILALLDKWRSKDYGDGLPDNRIDYETLRRYYAVAQARNDFCDYRFESRSTSAEADQLLAKTMRGVVLQRQGVKTIVRDELAKLPITMFTPTNTTEGSVSIDYVQTTEETADGVIAEYFSENTWQWEDVECPAPGFTYTTKSNPRYDSKMPMMQKPVRLRLEGITNSAHATREGMYYAAQNALRRQFVNWQTEMQGVLVHYGAPVIFTHTLYNSMASGEVVDYRSADGAIKVSMDMLSQWQIIFMNPDGTLTKPMPYKSLGDGWIMPEGDYGNVNWCDYASERTRCVAVDGEIIHRIVKITSLEPRGAGNSGAPEYALAGVVDVPQVHTCDAPWLPDGYSYA